MVVLKWLRFCLQGLIEENKNGNIMKHEELRKYARIKASTPEELELAFSILEVSEESKNKKVVMLIREGDIDFMLACKLLNTKSPTARRTADRVEKGLARLEKYVRMKQE